MATHAAVLAHSQTSDDLDQRLNFVSCGLISTMQQQFTVHLVAPGPELRKRMTMRNKISNNKWTTAANILPRLHSFDSKELD